MNADTLSLAESLAGIMNAYLAEEDMPTPPDKMSFYAIDRTSASDIPPGDARTILRPGFRPSDATSPGQWLRRAGDGREHRLITSLVDALQAHPRCRREWAPR